MQHKSLLSWNTVNIPRIKNKDIQEYKLENLDENGSYIGIIDSRNQDNASIKTCFGISNPVSENEFDSDILSDKNDKKQFIKLISSQLKRKNINITRIYSGKKDGFSAAKFHELCDNKGATISLISNDLNAIFGGYTSESWTSPSSFYKYKSDLTSFLYQFKPNLNIFDKKDEDGNHIFHYSTYMITFGDGYDLKISNDCHQNNESYTYPTTFEFNTKDLCGGIKPKGQQNFRVINIEVFVVE